MATVNTYYADVALQGCRRLGQDIGPLIAKADISEDLLKTTNSSIDESQMSELVQAIWASLQDEFMGFTEKACKPGCFAMMCELVSRCDTLDTMFSKAVGFYGLITEDIAMGYRQHSDRREFLVRMVKPEFDPNYFYLEFCLVIWIRFFSWIIGKRIKLQSAHFTHSEPEHSKEYEHLFACPCYFDQPETRLCFSKQYAGLPPVRTQRELADYLKRAPADVMTAPGSDDSLQREVKNLLLKEVERLKALPKFEDLAGTLHLSPQTIRRRLNAEGSSYQKIKDATRRDMAIEKLKTQQMKVNDVAEMLGFAEPRSFSRAFKQWTGMTPSQYRQEVEV